MSETPPAAELPQELLLCVFIHGHVHTILYFPCEITLTYCGTTRFKGTDETFGAFPERLKHVVSETISGLTVECITFPAYETKGELTVAVERFADWLTTLTVEREVSHGSGGGAGKAKIVLCGHSMGGLLAADTFLAIAHARPDKAAPLWPRIIACIAFDTPYLGIHPHVFKNTASKAFGYVQTAREVATSAGILSAIGGFAFGKKATDPNSPTSSSNTGLVTAPPPGTPPGEAQPVKRTGWQKWAPMAYGAGAAVLAGAAASTAYYKREEVTFGWTWATDHMKYVKNLWDEKALKDRVENVANTGTEVGVLFKTFYTYIPGKPPANPIPRTFVILPQSDSPYRSHFVPAHNTIALDEISAHTSMFQAGSNDGYYELGLLTAQAIRDGMMLCKDQ